MRILCFILLCSTFSFGQRDSVQSVPEVRIEQSLISIRSPRNIHSLYTVEEIRVLQPEDIGDLIRKFSGVNLKSYGGLGGLKTVSVRSLGNNHTAVVVDGFTMQNAQTGQVNLAQLQVDNVEAVIDTKGKALGLMLPVSAQIAGSSFLIQSFENTFSLDTLQIRANVKYGSFNRQDAYLGVKYSPGKFLFSAFGALRRADGKYPFAYLNGLQTTSGERLNNDYHEVNYGGTLGRKFKQGAFRIGYRQKTIRQGLPGAVILYNQTQNDRLNTDEKTAFSDYRFNTRNFYMRLYANGLLSSLRYVDPDYLNSPGGLDRNYLNRNAGGGFTMAYMIRWFSVFGGVEQSISDLSVNDSLFAKPLRFHNRGLLGLSYENSYVQAVMQVSSQYVSERNNNGSNAPDRFRINPSVSFSTKERRRMRWTHRVWYKNSFRMPTFNELYYNSIGNTQLLPEDANQFNYGFSVVPIERKFDLQLRANVFMNFVKNQIVAIPTKNLFIWSMQNVGITRVYGLELMGNVNWKIGKSWKITGDVNYTYQRTMDYTDSQSPTYKDQIAYIPVHTGNLDVSVQFKQTGLRFSNYAVSKRYALNENIEQNEVNGFWISDISVFHRFKLGTKQQLNLQFNVKNVFNKSYAYIRSYIMPGTNYLISLSYAFN